MVDGTNSVNKHNESKRLTKIMIVDDESDFREMLKIMLTKEGFVTETAVNGSDFLEKVDDFHPDIVTLDVMMPGLKTERILEQLKIKECKPKIILLTVVRYSEDEEKKLLEKKYIVDNIKKPFDFDDFICTVKKYM